MEFFPEQPLSQTQAELIARGLYSVARAEGGVKPQEAALIQSFYGEVNGGAHLAGLANAPKPTPEMLATTLGSGALATMFLKTCLLLAYADGEYHPKERAVVEEFALALGIGVDGLHRLEAGVKEFLLSNLTHLHNVEATSKVAQKLGL